MEEKNKEEDFKKTQIISPGALGEEVSRKKDKVINGKEKKINNAAQQEGLNEEKSKGSAGAFEGFENTEG